MGERSEEFRRIFPRAFGGAATLWGGATDRGRAWARFLCGNTNLDLRRGGTANGFEGSTRGPLLALCDRLRCGGVRRYRRRAPPDLFPGAGSGPDIVRAT